MKIEAFVEGPETAKVVSDFVAAFAKARAVDEAANRVMRGQGTSVDMAVAREIPGVKSNSGENIAAPAAEDKPKRGRGRPRKADKAKEEAKAEQPTPTPEPGPEPGPEPEVTVETEPAPNEIANIEDLVGDVIAPVTKEDVTKAMGALGDAKGLQAIATVFAAFNNSKLSDFSEDQYPELVDKLKEALG